jgi:seryl-tRNA synthetase
MSGWKGLIMFKRIKSVLKKFIPPPTDVFNREINRSIRHSEKQTKIIADLVKQSDKQNAKKLSDLANAVEQLKKENKEYKSKLLKLESDIRLVIIPLSILNLESNTIKTQNKQQIEMLMKLARQLDEDSKNQMIQLVEPDE